MLHCIVTAWVTCSTMYVVSKHFPQKIYKCARLVSFLHKVPRLNMDPRITCKRADLVSQCITMVAFVGLFPRLWKCVALLAQKQGGHWLMPQSGSLSHNVLYRGNLLTKMVQNQWKYLKEDKFRYLWNLVSTVTIYSGRRGRWDRWAS